MQGMNLDLELLRTSNYNRLINFAKIPECIAFFSFPLRSNIKNSRIFIGSIGNKVVTFPNDFVYVSCETQKANN